MIKKRANSPEQKAKRRQQILLATHARFTNASFEQVNLNHIASDIGITKAALYRYFRNKETLFLALFIESLEDLIHSFKGKTGNHSLASAIRNTLLDNPIYCKLSAILHTVLERNLTYEEATEFKRKILTLLTQYAQLIAENSALSSSQAITFLMQVQQALIGCWHMSHPVGAIAEVIEQEELHVFKQPFDDTLLSHIERLIQSNP